MSVKVDKERLIASVKIADEMKLESQNAVWEEAVRIYNSGEGLPKNFKSNNIQKIAKSTVYQRVRNWNIPIKTLRKKKGRPINPENHDQVKSIYEDIILKCIKELQKEAALFLWSKDYRSGWETLNEARQAIGMKPVKPVNMIEGGEYFDA